MTATLNSHSLADVRRLLERADRRFAHRTGDDPATPEYLTALVDAVASMLGNAPASAPAADVEVQRLTDLVAEFRKRDEAASRSIERLRDTIGRLTDEVTVLRRQRDEARNELEQQGNDLTGAHAALDGIAAEHHHLYEWRSPDTEPEPCSCGLLYPRFNRRGVPAGPPPSAPEPFAELFGQVRGGAGRWPR